MSLAVAKAEPDPHHPANLAATQPVTGASHSQPALTPAPVRAYNSRQQATKLLSELRRAGLIELAGGTKGARWHLSKKEAP